MTEKEKKRLLDRAARLKPRPTLLPSGSWRCQVTISGVRESVTADTPEAASAQAAAIKAGYLERSRDPLSLTVAAAFERYIESRDAVLSPSTIKGYNKIKNNLLDGLDALTLSALTQEAVQRWVNRLAKDHSPKTVRNAHGLLSAVLAEYKPAMTLRTTLPQKDAAQIRIPSESEIKTIIAAAAGTEMELPILLAVWLGLRASEIRGLEWGDVRDNMLHVRQAVVDGEEGPVLKKTKTTSGDRWIKLPEHILSILDRTPRRSQFIVTLSGQAMYKRFSRLCEKCGVPHYRFHDLRHTAASVSLFLGVPDKYSQQRMGHKTENMLKTVYQHTIRQKEEEYADRINDYFSNLIAHESHTDEP